MAVTQNFLLSWIVSGQISYRKISNISKTNRNVYKGEELQLLRKRQHTLRAPLRAKRGSLSLSINAIVIIVLAMTLLGLGLGFIRGLFKNIGETTGTVQEQVKQQILEDLKTGDKKLSFSTNSLQMESSGSQTITIGARNSKSSAAPMGFII